LFSIGSFPNSKRNIEPELSRIIMQNWKLDDLTYEQINNPKLAGALELVKSRATTGSLAIYDGFDFAELYRFMQIFRHHSDDSITGSEAFPGEMLNPKKERVSLPDDIYELLVQYYNTAYDSEFVTIADALTSKDSIVVSPKVDQYGRIRIGTEIFGATIAPRYKRNSHILAKFIQEDETTDIFPGTVQFFFEHTIELPIGTKTHHLAFVKWHLPAPNQQTRFYCKTNNGRSVCNIELWKYEYYETGRDSIIPIHNIYSRFVSSKFMVGSRRPKLYMAVIPINRQFHL
jgi:hypothetical protein